MDKSIVGTRYHDWTVIGVEGSHRLVQCVCGNKSRALNGDLVNGRTKRCRSCSHAARRGISNTAVVIHGMADTPTQWVWSDMKRRCFNPGRRGYENYGARGITVCERWLSFSNFLADMGPRPSSNYQIDRIDNDGNYEPGNCRWILRNDQNYNKRNTYKFSAFGRVFTLKDAESEYGIPKETIYHRLHILKMNPERAVTLPVRGSSQGGSWSLWP